MIIEVNDLTKKYGSLTAVDHLNLEVKEGEVFGLLGPNGSGKTTTINCILSILKYDSGTIRIFDKDMKPTAYDIKKQIGVVMQEVAVFNELSVYDNIDYFCGLYVKDSQERKKLVEDAIAFVELNEFRKFRPKKLSGGLLRRLNIACGIAHKPRLIILDEPTVAVDPQSRNKILEGIKKLNQQGSTIVYTSHYMEEIEELCTDIVIMDTGKVIAKGTKEEIKSMAQAREKVTVEVLETIPELEQKINELATVHSAQLDGNMLRVKSRRGMHSLADILSYCREQGIGTGNVYSEEPTLNDVFLDLTGKELRDHV